MDKELLERFITGWLARAHDHPDTARSEWTRHGVALLPLGRLFSAVRMGSRLVHAAVGSEELAIVTEELEFRLDGPVIHDSLAIGQPFYALIQWHAGVVWKADEDAPCLGDGVHLGVPRLDLVRPPGTFWLIPPQHDGDLCRPESVQRLIQQGRTALAADALGATA